MNEQVYESVWRAYSMADSQLPLVDAIEASAGNEAETRRLTQKLRIQAQNLASELDRALARFRQATNQAGSRGNGATKKGRKMFNLSKKAQKKDHAQPYESHLRDYSRGYGYEGNADAGNIDWHLRQDETPGHRHKDEVAWQTTQAQLDSARSGTNEGVTEKALDGNPKYYNNKRYEKSYDTDLNHAANRVSEGHYQQRRQEYQQAQNAQERDTSFWKNNRGDKQMVGERTKIVDNVQGSQLQNHPDRLENLRKTMPISSDAAENRKRLDKNEKYEKMVMASVRDADAMLFHIYATAAKQNRELSEREQQMVTDVNASKARRLAKLEKAAQDAMLTEDEMGAFEDEMGAGYADDFDIDEDAEGEILPDEEEDAGAEIFGRFGIEPDESGGWRVFDNETGMTVTEGYEDRAEAREVAQMMGGDLSEDESEDETEEAPELEDELGPGPDEVVSEENPEAV